MKMSAIIVAIVVGVAAYFFLLPPRSLECDVGLEGLTIHLQRSALTSAYGVSIDVAPGVELAVDLPRSSEIPEDQVPALQAILEVGNPDAPRIGSREFREAYCAGGE